MKKRAYLLAVLSVCLLLCGCQQQIADEAGAVAAANVNSSVVVSTPVEGIEKEVVEIKERLFIAQTNDIYLNAEDYFGKLIKYEGIFKTSYWAEGGETYYFVIRYGPGCCGYDGEAGFEVIWDGGWPEEDDWVEVVGELEVYEEGQQSYLRLKLSSLTVLEERGLEFVTT